MRAFNTIRTTSRFGPLLIFTRWSSASSQKLNQVSFDKTVSNAIQGYLSKNGDFLQAEYKRLSKIIASDRSNEVK